MAYATVDQLRAYLDQIPSETDAPNTDEDLAAVLDRATGIINAAIAAGLGLRSFAFGAYGDTPTTKLVTAWMGTYVTLPAHQVGSVTLIEYQNGGIPITYTTFDADYWAEEEDGRVYFPYVLNGWMAPTRLRVTAIWGYGPVPVEIEQIALELAVNIWRSRAKGSFAEFQGAEGGSYQRFVGGLTKMQAEVIANVAQRYWEPSI